MLVVIMMITTSLAKSRINQLIANDNSGDNAIDSYYKQSLSYIRDHLTQFYNHYAQQNNLSLAEVKSRVDKWGIGQWKQAIDELNMSGWPEQATLRARVYATMAGTTKQKMMIALIGMGMLAMTSKMHNFIKETSVNDAYGQLKWLEDNLELHFSKVKPVSIITQKSTKEIWSERLWTDMDGLAGDVEKMVNKHLKHGMSLYDLNTLFADHTNANQFKPEQSIADRIHIMDFNVRRIVRTESSRLIDEVNRTTYSLAGIKQVDILNQPGACGKCIDLANSGPYDVHNVPILPNSSHPNCKCIVIPSYGPYRHLITHNNIF